MMESSPDPLEPERQRPDSVEASRRRRIAGTEATARGKSYTEKPQLAPTGEKSDKPIPKRPPRWILVAVLAGVLAVSGFFWQQQTLTHWMHPSSAPQSTQTLTLTDADVDYAATEVARAALSRGEIPSVLTNADAETRRKIISGEEKLYTKRLLNENQPRGAVVHVQVSTHGVLLGEDILTTERPHGTTFPAASGVRTHFHFTTEQAGAKGVVSCYVNSANGGIVSTTPMATGQSSDLEVIAP